MKIEAKIIADSISTAGKRITTMQLCYPRFIHSEFMTHRMFSRNAMSSRAVPVAKMIEQVRNDPAMPIHWGKNQPGMQAHEELKGKAKSNAIENWKQAAVYAADTAEYLSADGAHKQIVNRILEPFQWMHTVVTATEWDNFFELRCHADAQPEIHALACAMRDAMKESSPTTRFDFVWHLPYVADEERERIAIDDLRKISAARCARVSYLKHDGAAPNIEDDLKLFERLAGGKPIHASPLEHQAVPLPKATDRSRNFCGWLQFREMYENKGKIT